MFPLSHTYVSTKVTGKKSPLLVFGSVLPDIATTSRNNIGRDKIHYAPNEFRHFVDSKFPDLADLAIGVDLHSHINKGADFYSDNSEIGFAYIYGRKIVGRVTHLLGINDEQKGLVLSHNLIEAAVDINLKESHPEIFSLYTHSFNNVDRVKVGHCLSDYLSLPEEIIEAELETFMGFLGPESLASKDAILDLIALPLIFMRFGKNVDRTEADTILSQAVAMMKEQHLNILDHAVSEIAAHGKIKI